MWAAACYTQPRNTRPYLQVRMWGRWGGRILRDEPADEIMKTDSHSPLFEKTMKSLVLTRRVMFPVRGICLGRTSVTHLGKF